MMNNSKLIWWVIRILRQATGWHSIKDGSTCKYDLHDYPTQHGGDGSPSHFHTYKCPKCGAEFTI